MSDETTWGAVIYQRAGNGGPTDLALAVEALCDAHTCCGSDATEGCCACLCERALRGLWERLTETESERDDLRYERDAMIAEAEERDEP
mgnify:CR=1 FL=1